MGSTRTGRSDGPSTRFDAVRRSRRRWCNRGGALCRGRPMPYGSARHQENPLGRRFQRWNYRRQFRPDVSRARSHLDLHTGPAGQDTRRLREGVGRRGKGSSHGNREVRNDRVLRANRYYLGYGPQEGERAFSSLAERRAKENRHALVYWTLEVAILGRPDRARSEEHTSELQSLMRITYAVIC